jgi:hypothetical protein
MASVTRVQAIENYLKAMNELYSKARNGERTTAKDITLKHKVSPMAIKAMEELGYVKRSSNDNKTFIWKVQAPEPIMAKRALEWIGEYTNNHSGRVRNKINNTSPVEFKEDHKTVIQTPKPKRKYTKKATAKSKPNKTITKTFVKVNKVSTSVYYLLGFIPFLTKKTTCNA